MNLLQNRSIDGIDHTSPTGITTDNFRAYQYSLIPYFCDVIVDFISQQNNNYLKMVNKKFIDKINYFGICNSQLSNFSINVIKELDPEQKQLFDLYIPKLIDDNLFYLNGNYYVPSMYVIDLPIILKKNSIKLSGLFNSVTIYIKEDFVIFTGKNMPLHYILQLLLTDDQEGIDIYTQFKLKYPKHNAIVSTEKNLIAYFSNVFRLFTCREEIIKFLDDLFLDKYTKELYKSCYPDLQNISIKDILRNAIKKDLNEEIPNFIDLNHKRLIFIELLLRPLFKKVASTAIGCTKGFMPDIISINNLTLVKHFLSSPESDQTKTKEGLSGNYIYNDVNLYTSILSNKISMVPVGIENAPKEVQSIHPSHFGRICPISISSQKPGHVVSVIPGTKLDYFGRFI